MELWNKYKTLLDKSGINTPLRLSHFFAQIHHESNLKPISENLNYSKEGLLKIFPKYFNSTNAGVFARKPQMIANRVYANRMGNGDSKSNEGYKFRGRGMIQLTGKDNYLQLSRDTGIDFISNPDLLLTEVNALISAIWFWNKNNLNSLADNDDILMITRKINGGTNGLDHRKELLKKYKQIFK